jgi:hypothetical protein
MGLTSQVPYGEPAWLVPDFKSPYYTDSHRAFQQGMFPQDPSVWVWGSFVADILVIRKFVDEVITPDAQSCEESGKRASKEVLEAMA